MHVEDQNAPPPDPRDVTSFVELTTQLRELYTWAGRPKYATLSAASGLAPSAISNLIGKRPLRRPSEAATLRFVEACLHHAGDPAAGTPERVEEWRTTWRRLDAVADGPPAPQDVVPPRATTPGADAAAPAPGPQHPVPSRASRRSRRTLLIGVCLAVLVAAVGVGVRIGTGLGDADPQPAARNGALSKARCTHTEIPEAHDVRNQRTWHQVFRCPNELGAKVRLDPAPGSPVVSVLNHSENWFVCWARGKEHAGGNPYWYYTQGDTKGSHPEVHSWGFVAADQMDTEVDPDPRAFRECPKR